MKKNGLVISILLAIVLLHAAVLYVCLRNPDKAPKTEKKEKTEQKTDPKETPKEEPKVQDQRTFVTPEEYRKLRKRTSKAGQPYLYKWAVNGNIPEIPDSSVIKAGILVDITTRNVLWCKNPRKSVSIASMTKLMTVLLAYEEALSGSGISLDTPVRVTRAASKIGGSQVYLDPRETFPLSELMRAASIQSANDAAYLIAEFLGHGNVYDFVGRMNSRAVALGMKNTRFFNPHGLPVGNDNVSSPEDMVRLAEATMEHPLLMEWASTLNATFRPGKKGTVMMRNHNHLLPGASDGYPGVNGLKTGYTGRSLFCVTISCSRPGHQLVAVMMGAPTRKERDRFAVRLLDWGYERADNPEAALRRPVKKTVQKSVQKKSKYRKRK